MIGLLGAASVTAGAIVVPATSATSAATSASNSIHMSKNRHSGRTMHFGCTGQCGDIIIISKDNLQ